LTEREHTGKKIVDCQIIGPAAAGSAGYVASPMYREPTRPTQPFILSGYINEQQAAIICPQSQSGEAPSGERLRGKGRYGVICR